MSCKKEEKLPFTIGSRFSYAASYTTTEERITKYDTLTVTILEHDITSYSPGRKKIRWENTRHDYYQLRNLNADEKITELQLPTNYIGFANELVAIPGHPLVMPSAAPGDTIGKENDYKSGYSTLNGYKIKHHTTYLRDTSILFDGEELKCQLWESHNTSGIKQFGRYSVVYTYSPAYGFITLNYYYPDRKRVTMQLVDIAITGK